MKAARHVKPTVLTRFTGLLRALLIPLAMSSSAAGCTHAAVLGSLAVLQTSLAPAARQALALGALALAEDPDEEPDGTRRGDRRSGTSRATKRAKRSGARRGTADEAGAGSDRDVDGVAADTDAGDPDSDASGSASSRERRRPAGATRQDPFSVGKAGKRASGSRGRSTGVTLRITEDADDTDDTDDTDSTDSTDAAGGRAELGDGEDDGDASLAVGNRGRSQGGASGPAARARGPRSGGVTPAATTDAPVPRQTRSNIRPAAPGQGHAISARQRRARAAMPDHGEAEEFHRSEQRRRNPCRAPERSAQQRAACRRREPRDS